MFGLKEDDPLRNAKLGGFIAVVLLGWVFVVWSNHFHITAPVVFVCLGYLAVVATVLNLWRTGAAAVAPDDPSEGAWDRPIGARGELEKEKRTLLKAIKEAEFDLAMGKLSQADSDALIRSYRARAIEVIKELDRLEAGTALSARDQIQREVKARIELAEQDKPSKRAQNVVDKKAAKAEAKTKTPEARAEAAKAAKAAERADEGDNDSIEAAENVEAKPEATRDAAKPEAKVDARSAAKPEAKPDAKADAPTPAEAVSDAVTKDDDSSKTPNPDRAEAAT